MTTWLFSAFFVFLGLAYMIFGRISSKAYAARPFDPTQPPRSPARYFWKTYRELYPDSWLPQACVACVALALLVLLAAPFALGH